MIYLSPAFRISDYPQTYYSLQSPEECIWPMHMQGVYEEGADGHRLPPCVG